MVLYVIARATHGSETIRPGSWSTGILQDLWYPIAAMKHEVRCGCSGKFILVGNRGREYNGGQLCNANVTKQVNNLPYICCQFVGISQPEL